MAKLLRDLAHDVGDADALREAYAALARAPEYRASATALFSLLAGLRDEDVGTEGERRAIGLPILLQAFERAEVEELSLVGLEAETYARAFVRADPPNVGSAVRLRPVLERAREAAEPAQRTRYEDVLREIDAAATGEVEADAPRALLTVSSPLKALEGVTALSANVDVLVSARESARKWGKAGVDYVDELMEALRAVAVVADRYARNEVGKDGFVAAFAETGQVLVPRESESTETNRKARRARLVTDDLGRPVLLSPHLKFGKKFRLYLAYDEGRRHIQIGWVGEHLPTGGAKGR